MVIKALARRQMENGNDFLGDSENYVFDGYDGLDAEYRVDMGEWSGKYTTSVESDLDRIAGSVYRVLFELSIIPTKILGYSLRFMILFFVFLHRIFPIPDDN